MIKEVFFVFFFQCVLPMSYVSRTHCCGVPGPKWQSVTNWTFMTLFFQEQGERVSHIFSLQPSQAVKEIAAGSPSPHYTSSQWNAAFSLPGRQASESWLLWPFTDGRTAMKARGLCSLQSQ